MTVRVFTCASCGHRMRLAGDSCGRCHTPKRLHQRLGFWIALGLGLALAGLALAAG